MRGHITRRDFLMSVGALGFETMVTESGAAEVVSVRSFIELADAVVPTEATFVRSQGYREPGVGGALYRRTDNRKTTAWRRATRDGRFFELAESSPTPEMFGATTRFRSLDGCAISAGSKELTCATGTFTQADVGAVIYIDQAGAPSGRGQGPGALGFHADIVGVESSWQVLLDRPAVSTCAGVAADVGFPQDEALQTAIEAVRDLGGTSLTFQSEGSYFFSGEAIFDVSLLTLRAQGATIRGGQFQWRSGRGGGIVGGRWADHAGAPFGGQFLIGTVEGGPADLLFSSFSATTDYMSYTFDLRNGADLHFADLDIAHHRYKKSPFGVTGGERIEIIRVRASCVGHDLGDDWLGGSCATGNLRNVSVSNCYGKGFVAPLSLNTHNHHFEVRNISCVNFTGKNMQYVAVVKPGGYMSIPPGGGTISGISVDNVKFFDHRGTRMRGVLLVYVREEFEDIPSVASDISIRNCILIGPVGPGSEGIVTLRVEENRPGLVSISNVTVENIRWLVGILGNPPPHLLVTNQKTCDTAALCGIAISNIDIDRIGNMVLHKNVNCQFGANSVKIENIYVKSFKD